MMMKLDKKLLKINSNLCQNVILVSLTLTALKKELEKDLGRRWFGKTSMLLIFNTLKQLLEQRNLHNIYLFIPIGSDMLLIKTKVNKQNYLQIKNATKKSEPKESLIFVILLRIPSLINLRLEGMKEIICLTLLKSMINSRIM